MEPVAETIPAIAEQSWKLPDDWSPGQLKFLETDDRRETQDTELINESLDEKVVQEQKPAPVPEPVTKPEPVPVEKRIFPIEEPQPSQLQQLVEPVLNKDTNIISDLGKVVSSAKRTGHVAVNRILQGTNDQLKDFLYQPQLVLGATPTGNTFHAIAFDDKGQPIIDIRPDGTPQFRMEERPEVVPNRVTELIFGKGSSTTVSLLGENALFGQRGTARKEAPDGTWPGYAFGLGTEPLPVPDANFAETFGGELGAVLLHMYGQTVLMKKAGIPSQKVNLPFQKFAANLIRQGGWKTIKGLSVKGASEFAFSGYIAQRTMYSPGESSFPNLFADSLIHFGDGIGIDFRNPILNFFKSGDGSTPYHIARLKADVSDFLQAPPIGAIFENVTYGLSKGFKKIRLERRIDQMTDLIVKAIQNDKNQVDLENAKYLAKKGPTTDLVLPTRRVTGRPNNEISPSPKVQEKSTQAELNQQVKDRQTDLDASAKELEDASKELAKPINRKLSDQFGEQMEGVQKSVDSALDTVHTQNQRDLRKATLEGLDLTLLRDNNVEELPRTATLDQIQTHLKRLDAEQTRREIALDNQSLAVEDLDSLEVKESGIRALNRRKKILEAALERAGVNPDSPADQVIQIAEPVAEQVFSEAAWKEMLDEPKYQELKELWEEGEQLRENIEESFENINLILDEGLKATEDFEQLLKDLDDAREIIGTNIDKTTEDFEQLLKADDPNNLERGEVLEEVKRSLEHQYANLDIKESEIKARMAEGKAVDVDEISPLVDKEQFTKYFNDLSMDEQQELLSQLRINGAIVTIPTKIGEAPPPTDAIKSKRFKPGGLADTLRQVTEALKESDRKTKEAFDGVVQVAKDAIDLAEGKIPKREGPIVDITATRVDETKPQVKPKLLEGKKDQPIINNAFAPVDTKAPPQLKATISRYRSAWQRKTRVLFESDIDIAILAFDAKTQSKNHGYIVKWLIQDLRLDPTVIREVGSKLRKKIWKHKKDTRNTYITIPDTRTAEKRGGDTSLMINEPIEEEIARLKAKEEASLMEKYKNPDPELIKKYKEEGITSEEYDAVTNPKDPGDQLDPSNKPLMAELPELPELPSNLTGGSLGSAYINRYGHLNIKQRVRRMLVDMLRKDGWTLQQAKNAWKLASVSDAKTRLIPSELKATISEYQAQMYGTPERIGEVVDIWGAYNVEENILVLAMLSDGNLRSFHGLLATKYHEGFHALWRNFLTDHEIEVLGKDIDILRELTLRSKIGESQYWDAKQHGPETIIASIKDRVGNMELEELAAHSFQNWLLYRDDYLGTGVAKVFNKIRRFLGRIERKLKVDLGFTRWDDIFEEALFHDIRKRGPIRPTRRDPQIAYSIDPDELVEGMGKYKDGIENGEIDVNTAMESESRRLISRSGKTDYINRENKDIIAMNRAFEDAFREAFGDRATATKIDSVKLKQVFDHAANAVKADGYNVDATINRYEHARKGDISSKEDLYAAAGILHHRDVNLSQAAQASLEYKGGRTNEETAEAGQRLLARTTDQIKLEIAWQTLTRKTGQLLRLAATPHEDVMGSALAAGVELKMTTSDAAVASALRDGFTPQQGFLGDGVYFSTNQVPGLPDSVELYGNVPQDISILDLVSTNKRITDLVHELNLGKIKSSPDGIELTPAQQTGIKSWAEDQGYGGIRYGTDFTNKPLTGDQVVIFDTNTANRVIDSEAAIPPQKPEGPSFKSILDAAITGAANTLEKKLPATVLKSIKSKKLTPEAIQTLDRLTELTWFMKNNPSARATAAELMVKVPDGGLNPNVFASIYRNLIFFNTRTWMKVLLGSVYRGATLPITQAMGEAMQMPGMDAAARKAARQRISLDMGIYPKYLQNLPYAWKMMTEAIKHNEVFVNVGRRKYEADGGRGLPTDPDQLELDLKAQQLTEQIPDDHFSADIDANPIAQGLYYGAKALKAIEKGSSVSSRIMGGFDTFVAGMVGPASEWGRIMELELANAEVKGFEPGSNKAWDYASRKTDEIIKASIEDVDLANGTIIKNGRLKGEQAKHAMDWVNFTDSVKVRAEKKDYQYGVLKARQQGITNPREIVEWVDQWMREEVDQGTHFRQAMQGLINLPADFIQKGHRSKNPVISNLSGIMIPIVRTPHNLIKSTLRFTPLNRYVDSYWRDINSQNPNTRARALGETGIAYTAFSLALMLAASQHVEFTGPVNQFNTTIRDKQIRSGRQPWSIRFKNPRTSEWTPYYSIEAFDQLATVFGGVGAYIDNYASKDHTEEDLMAFAGGVIATIAGTSVQVGLGQFMKGPMQGLTDIVDLVTELSRDENLRAKAGARQPFEYYVTQRLAGFWPGFSNAARNAVDPYMKQIDAASPKPIWGLDIIENLAKTMAAKTPGLSATQPNRLHPITGNPVPSYGVPGSQMISPDEPFLKMFHDVAMPLSAFKTRTLSTDLVDEELLRLHGTGSGLRIWHRRMFNLPDRKLYTTELNRLIVIGTQEIKIHGLTLHEALESQIRSSRYQSLSPYPPYEGKNSERIAKLREVIRPYVEAAKARFIAEFDTGPNSLGWLIKEQESRNLQFKYDVEYGKQSSLPTWRQLAGT